MKYTIYTINVTEDDIKNGKPKESMHCPVAIACHRAAPDHNFSILHDEIEVDESGVIAECPWSVFDFVEAFDSGRKVQPFTFELELVEL